MIELINEDMKTIIIAVFHMFKNGEKRLERHTKKKTKIEFPELKMAMCNTKNILNGINNKYCKIQD